MYLSDIRVAISSGQRPSAVILNDAYAGHRKWWVWDWKEDPALTSVYTEWDYILLRAYQYLDDYTTPNGHLAWVEEDPDVGWEIDRVESGYERAMHNFRENNELKPWEATRAKPVWDEEEAEPPSMQKWLKRLEEESGGGFPAMPQGGVPRPPTPEELAALDNLGENPPVL